MCVCDAVRVFDDLMVHGSLSFPLSYVLVIDVLCSANEIERDKGRGNSGKIISKTWTGDGMRL